MCGIPCVTLLGEKSDWELLLSGVEKLLSFGEEPCQWFKLLQPILKRFALSFEDPKCNEVISFWQRIAHADSMGGGSRCYSGWITAFRFWDADGNCKHHPDEQGEDVSNQSWEIGKRSQYSNLVLDGAIYHRVDSDKVPPGYSSVPVLIINNVLEVLAMMIAGSVGTRRTNSGRELETGGTGLDTLQAVTDWWMLEKKSQEQMDEEARLEKQREEETWLEVKRTMSEMYHVGKEEGNIFGCSSSLTEVFDRCERRFPHTGQYLHLNHLHGPVFERSSVSVTLPVSLN